MRFVRPNDAGNVHRLYDAVCSEDVTYGVVGCTSRAGAVDGYHRERSEIHLGEGSDVFNRAVEGLKTWKAHRLPGMKVVPSDREITTGGSVIVTLGSPLLSLAIPGRIVEVIDEDDRWGFAYGTLPGHPVEGEESFVVSRSDTGDVRFEIVADSRPGHPMIRLMSPFVRTAQSLATRGYQRSLQRFVDAGT